MHNSGWCLSMYGHQWSQAITAFTIKTCLLATKLHMLNFCERMQGLCRDILWLWPMGTDNAEHKKIFCFSKRKSKAKIWKCNNGFRKVDILKLIPKRYAIHIPPNTKDLAINLAMVAYGNRQNAITFARANNSYLLRALKHLMETRL